MYTAAWWNHGCRYLMINKNVNVYRYYQLITMSFWTRKQILILSRANFTIFFFDSIIFFRAVLQQQRNCSAVILFVIIVFLFSFSRHPRYTPELFCFLICSVSCIIRIYPLHLPHCSIIHIPTSVYIYIRTHLLYYCVLYYNNWPSPYRFAIV